MTVVAANRDDAVRQFERLKERDRSAFLRPRCAVDGCGRLSVALFNVAWLCAEHCSAALSELRSLGMRRPVEFLGDVSSLLVERPPRDD